MDQEHKECRAPHGARGLKQLRCFGRAVDWRSRPPRGAWIETSWWDWHTNAQIVAPPTGRVD